MNSVVTQAIQNARRNLATYGAALDALESDPAIAGLSEVPTTDLVRRLTTFEIEQLEAALIHACEPIAAFVYGEGGAHRPRFLQLEHDAGDINSVVRFLTDPLRHERERRYKIRAMRHATVATPGPGTSERQIA